MPKTGSTFLGRFSRDLALRQQMCKVNQYTKEFVCETVSYVDCPRNELHRKSVHLERAFYRPAADLSQHAGPDATFGAWDCGVPEKIDRQWRCTRAVGASKPTYAHRCGNALRRQMFIAANEWLRTTERHVDKYRYNFTLHALLESRGFVRGPLRQLNTEFDAGAVPYFRGFANVIIVHTRHPVEMMVSVFFCIADPKVCPVRAKFLGNHVPVNDTISSLDKFVLAGVRQQGSTPWHIVERSERLAQFMRAFRADWQRAVEGAPGERLRAGCAAPMLIHSKYEDMVSGFSAWAQRLIGPLMGVTQPSKQRGVLATLLARYQNDFVPDGKHKHTLTKGANIAKLKRSTVRHLMRQRRLRSLLSDLSYDWLGHDGT